MQHYRHDESGTHRGRTGHSLVGVQYSGVAVNGLLKDAVLTGSTISEWNGPTGTYLFGGGVHRAPGGIAISQLTQGTGGLVMKDGTAVGTEASGTVVFKFASGTLAALSGKVAKFVSKPTSRGRFNLEFTD